jgi:hypothetical protein
VVPCKRLFNFMMLHDGKVRLCGCRFRSNEHDDMIVGDANLASLDEISQGENVAQIVNGFFHDRVPESCRNCAIYDPVTPRWIEDGKVDTQKRDLMSRPSSGHCEEPQPLLHENEGANHINHVGRVGL